MLDMIAQETPATSPKCKRALDSKCARVKPDQNFLPRTKDLKLLDIFCGAAAMSTAWGRALNNSFPKKVGSMPAELLLLVIPPMDQVAWRF